MSAVKKNDRLGWGIFYANEDVVNNNTLATNVENKKTTAKHDRLIVCFLTINRQVVYLRVLYQPPGGFFPVVIAPPNGKNLLKMAINQFESFIGDILRF